MRKLFFSLMIIIAAAALYGCRDASPEVQRVPTPAPGNDTARSEYDRPKPLPGPEQGGAQGPTPFYDEPLLVDTPPEAKRFVETYKQVGTPRIVVFVNRGLNGQILPVTDPGKYVTSKEVYLQAGQYDEAKARQIDYDMMEVLLADWMSADNQVAIVSPTTVHRQLTEQEQRDLQAGKPNALGDVGKRLDADVLIQVQAKPTRQTVNGELEVRVIAEAINVKGGESLARAAVDVIPPLDKIQTNRSMRFLARKLMDGMSNTWSAPAAPAKKE